MVNITLVIHHLFTALAVLIMLSRLIASKVVFHKFQLGEYLTVVAIVCIAARAGLIHVVLTWGTNNLSAAARLKIDFTDEEIYRRTIGSKFAITNRPIYNTYLWLQKVILLDFYLRNFHSGNTRLRDKSIAWGFGVVFAITWVAAIIVGFTECDPFPLYWQVVPDPGSCVRAQLQLVLLGVLNIVHISIVMAVEHFANCAQVTDAMILVLPIPTLIALRTPWQRKLRLYILCTLGVFIIAVTIIRLPINSLNAAVQANRTTWASTEILTAALVVNAPMLYGAFNRWRGRKRAGYPSASQKCSSADVPTIGGSGGKRSHIVIHMRDSIRKPASLDDNDSDDIMLTSRGEVVVTSNGMPFPGSYGSENEITVTKEVLVRDAESIHTSRSA